MVLEWPAFVQPLWASKGLRAAFEASRAMLVRTRPPAVMLHGVYEDLIEDGLSVQNDIQALIGASTEFFWAVAGDWHYSAVENGRMTPAEILALRVQTAQAAVAAGVKQFQWNCESAWKHGTAGFNVQAARTMILAVREACPGLVQSLTSYAQPMLHTTFAWQGFYAVDWYAPQIYWVGRGNGYACYDKHVASWNRAKGLGWISSAPTQPYVYGKNVRCVETSWIADKMQTELYWVTPGYLDGQGETCMAALVALREKGYLGPGRVRRYQADHPPLQVDGKIGPKTCQSLGVPWKEA